jgi:hypothetical protein
MSDKKDTFWGGFIGGAVAIGSLPVALVKAGYDKLEGNDTFSNSFESLVDKGFAAGKGFGDDNAQAINGGIAGSLAFAAAAAALAQGKPPTGR